MTNGPSLEDRMRTEFRRMRGEVRATRGAPGPLLARARRRMAVTVVGVVVAMGLVVGGSLVAWNALGTNGPGVPATRGSSATPTQAPTGVAPSAAAAELRSRPLSLPSLAPGAACPTTPTMTITPGPGTGFTGSTLAQRAGDVYLTMAGPHVRLRPSDRDVEGWYGIKDVWVVDSKYRGPLLIRGGRIDRPGPVRFRFTPETPLQRALLLDESPPSLEGAASTWWWSVPTAAYVRTPGCYAFQIDGTDFTSYITFSASR